jgi:hypothetical protein
VRNSIQLAAATLLLLPLAVASLAAPPPSYDPEAGELLQEIPAQRVQEILTPAMLERKAAYPPDLPQELMDNLIHKTRSIMGFKQYFAEKGKLTPEGCVQSSLWEYELEHAPRDLSKISLLELVQRAELAVVATVIENQSYFSFGGFSSRVTVRIEELLDPAPEGLKIGDEVTFSSPFYDFTVGNERLCSVRTGIEAPRPGESLLLLGRTNDQVLNELFVANFFRVQATEVQPAPYSFLDQTQTATLEELKERRPMASPSLEE